MSPKLILASLLSAAFLYESPVLLAQPQPPQAQKASAQADALTIYSAGLEALLVDPKDKGLVNALRLLDERILELPNETNDREMPAAALQLVLELFLSPMSFRAGIDPNADPQQGPPFYAQFTFPTGDQAKAEALAGRFAGTVAGMAPFPSQPATKVPGMQMMDLNGVPLYHGALKGAGPAGTAFTIALNKVDPKPLNLGRMDLPEGVKPAFAFILDAQQLQPLIEMMMAQAGPQSEMIASQLQMMGFYGPDATAISVATGHSADRSHLAFRYAKYRKVMEKMKALPEGRLTVNDLRRVPADATYAQVSKFNAASIGQSIAMMAGGVAGEAGDEMPDPLAMVEQQTGIHPQRDILDHLGQTMAIYMSDTTGGGGLLSTAAFVEVKNADALGQTMTRINGMINQIAQQHAKGYVRIVNRTINNQAVTVLNFPGLPVPLELCWSLTDGYLYAAGSPQALLAAINHGRTGKSGLGDNPRFKEAGGDQLNDAMQVTFIDTPRLIRNGYGIMTLAMAALSNAVRSPTDPARDPGLVMPSYSELAQNAKAAVTITRIQGDDLVMTGQSDRSFLVNACGSIGVLGGPTGALVAASLGTGLMLPALSKARETAKEVKSATQLRAISMAMMVYSQEFDDALPPDMQTLIDKQYLTADLLCSPMDPLEDNEPDYWIDFSVRKLSSIQRPDRRVLGYDQAMYAHGDKVAVVFFDGHVEQLPVDEFEELLESPPNAGVDFELPE